MKNQFALTRQILTSNFRRVSFPYKLNFCLTYKCNSKCLSCDIWKIKSTNELTTNEISDFFKYSNKFLWIDVTGGEVFLRKDIVEIADIILQSCKDLYHLHIPTNSIVTQLTVDKIKQILNLSPKPNKFTITLSIDGPPELHDRVRGALSLGHESDQPLVGAQVERRLADAAAPPYRDELIHEQDARVQLVDQ